MKLICLLFFSVLIAERALALPNPAAVYCERWGYEYKNVQTPEGKKGVVIIEPGVQFDAWDFFRGKVGKEYSFGAFYGYETECVRTNIGTYVAEYAVCVSQGERNQKSAIRIPLLDIMEQKGVPLFDKTADEGRKASKGAYVPANREEDMLGIYDVMGEGRMIPASFDWRTNNGHAYIGSIRDQGSCGSCYAFAAAASAEGTYNWTNGAYDADCIDFSESFIIWCLGRQPQYTNHFFGCNGADYDYAELTALTAEGICLEADFPYTKTDPGSCTHWSDPVTVFSSWHRILCGDVDAIKTAIMTYGVVDAAVYASSSFNAYSSGIYTDANITCYSDPCYYTPVNHAIALVGWDDNPPEGGGGCWILRNSWGTSWGESGYMRIRYNAARVACEACYFIYLGANTHTLNVTSLYGGADPAAGITMHNHDASITCSITNSPVIDGTTQFVCSGWSGVGSVPATGSGTNTGPFALTNNSTIVWHWQTNISSGVSADYDGDGLADPAIYDEATGIWKVKLSSANYSLLITTFSGLGGPGYASVAADYDGDNKADPAVYQELTGVWIVLPSSLGYTTPLVLSQTLGGIGYSGMPADYDGDKLADPGVYQREQGDWKVLLSSANYYSVELLGLLGGTSYRAVAADYDGDKLADPAVYGESNGYWIFKLSGIGYIEFALMQTLGGTGYIPVPADYDGDGLADPAVKSESGNEWIVMFSSGGYTPVPLTIQFE